MQGGGNTNTNTNTKPMSRKIHDTRPDRIDCAQEICTIQEFSNAHWIATSTSASLNTAFENLAHRKHISNTLSSQKFIEPLEYEEGGGDGWRVHRPAPSGDGSAPSTGRTQRSRGRRAPSYVVPAPSTSTITGERGFDRNNHAPRSWSGVFGVEE